MADNEGEHIDKGEELEPERRQDENLRGLIQELEESDGGAFGILTTEGYRQLTANIHRLARLVLIGMLVQLAVIIYVFVTDFHGRDIALTAARGGCERDKRDREANAVGWRIAEEARRAEGQHKVADQYRDIAAPMELRAKINCDKLYPKASWLP